MDLKKTLVAGVAALGMSFGASAASKTQEEGIQPLSSGPAVAAQSIDGANYEYREKMDVGTFLQQSNSLVSQARANVAQRIVQDHLQQHPELAASDISVDLSGVKHMYDQKTGEFHLTVDHYEVVVEKALDDDFGPEMSIEEQLAEQNSFDELSKEERRVALAEEWGVEPENILEYDLLSSAEQQKMREQIGAELGVAPEDVMRADLMTQEEMDAQAQARAEYRQELWNEPEISVGGAQFEGPSIDDQLAELGYDVNSLPAEIAADKEGFLNFVKRRLEQDRSNSVADDLEEKAQEMSMDLEL